MLRKYLILTLLLLLPSCVFAEDSPIGTWVTRNEDSQRPASLVTITQENGVLVGRIQELLPDARFQAADVCVSCPEPFKNQAILGLQFLWGFTPDKQPGSWKEGHVLDPLSGHIYKGTLRLVDQGQKLELRGYWGPFWRSQTWERKQS